MFQSDKDTSKLATTAMAALSKLALDAPMADTQLERCRCKTVKTAAQLLHTFGGVLAEAAIAILDKELALANSLADSKADLDPLLSVGKVCPD